METSGKQLFMYFDQKALRNAAECERKVRMMESLDICSPKFSFLRAETDMKHQKICILCDVLMDQAVLPGVGNIIKNEALFDSGLHLAVKGCKTRSPLYKHSKVYRCPTCHQCSRKITVSLGRE